MISPHSHMCMLNNLDFHVYIHMSYVQVIVTSLRSWLK